MVGGTISNATGGKFGNGAMSAAFAQLYNEEKSLERYNAQKKKTNVVGGQFEKLACKSDLCVMRSKTFNTTEDIADHQTVNNMRTAIKTTAVSLVGGAVGGTVGGITAALATGKGILVDTQVSYPLQVGDTIIDEISANFVTGYHSDSGLDNVIITQTVVNSDGVIMTRSQGEPGFW